MDTIDLENCSPESLLAAALYLMTRYTGTGCPGLARCVAQHLQCLCVHPDADPVIRDICAGLQGAWSKLASACPPEATVH
jgi:hypothetical protein